MKKTFLIFLFLMVAGFGYIILDKEDTEVDNTPEISQKEQDFNNSGQAKAILDETDLWKFYESKDGGFSIKYPHDVSFDGDSNKSFDLTIEVDEVSGLEGTMGYNEETALVNIEALKNGQYGEGVDFSFEASEKVRNIDGVNAQDFIVLGRFEVCDVTFERKSYFFNDGKQVVITLKGDEDMIKSGMSDYFETNEANCGNEKIWDFDKQGEFYKELSENRGIGIAQDWFNSFDRIIDTIEFNKEASNNLSLIQGKWTSVEDSNSVIEFNGNTKIDYYSGSKMDEGSFGLYEGKSFINSNNNGSYLRATIDGDSFDYYIVSVSEDSLVLSYLPRGNTLNYRR
jgi:hypothetical protein